MSGRLFKKNPATERIDPNWEIPPTGPARDMALFQPETQNQRDVRPKTASKREYSITSWGGGAAATYTLTVIVDHGVDPAATVTQVPDGTTFADGANVVLTAVVSDDEVYLFTAWTGDVLAGHEADNPLTVIMNSNKTITATFE
jgi:hypothetical protein